MLGTVEPRSDNGSAGLRVRLRPVGRPPRHAPAPRVPERRQWHSGPCVPAGLAGGGTYTATSCGSDEPSNLWAHRARWPLCVLRSADRSLREEVAEAKHRERSVENRGPIVQESELPSELGESLTVGVEDLDDQARTRAALRGVYRGGIRSQCQCHAVADDGAGDVNRHDGNAVEVHKRVVLIDGHGHREPAGLGEEVAEAFVNADTGEMFHGWCVSRSWRREKRKYRY